jgi:ABC-type amino acid transport substrate-binding protein
MNKKIVSLSLIVSIISILYITFNNKTTQKESPLIIGITASYAPYISINEQGHYEGFDIDVAHALAEKLNRKIEFKDLGSMAPLMIALDQGSIDMIIWGLTITQERLEKIAMIHYQGQKTKTNPLIFWQTVPNNFKTLDDAKGLIISVEPASFQANILAHYPEIMILPTEKVDDALLNIQYGKSDAAFIDPEIAKKFKAKYQEIQIVDVPLKEHEQALGIGIAIKKDNQQLINQIGSAINELKNNGTIEQLELKWNMQ